MENNLSKQSSPFEFGIKPRYRFATFMLEIFVLHVKISTFFIKYESFKRMIRAIHP